MDIDKMAAGKEAASLFDLIDESTAEELTAELKKHGVDFAENPLLRAERARILAALEKLEHHGTWQDGRPMFWRADEVEKVVRGDAPDK